MFPRFSIYTVVLFVWWFWYSFLIHTTNKYLGLSRLEIHQSRFFYSLVSAATQVIYWVHEGIAFRRLDNSPWLRWESEFSPWPSFVPSSVCFFFLLVRCISQLWCPLKLFMSLCWAESEHIESALYTSYSKTSVLNILVNFCW